MTTLTIPKDALVMLVGAAGSGKSTFASKHFRATEIVASDTCREVVSDDATNQRASGEAFALFHCWVEQRLKLGRLTVADSTALKPGAREKLRGLAAQYNRPVVAITVVADEETALKQNASRKRQVPEHVVKGHVEQATEVGYVLPNEGYHQILKVFPRQQYEIRFTGDEEKGLVVAPGFDIIGDVHGCLLELCDLLRLLGWFVGIQPFTKEWSIVPPQEGRKLIFVGDLTDRGPDSLSVLAMVKALVEQGFAESVLGNHDDKLRRKLKGNNVQMAHGLAETWAVLEAKCTPEVLKGYQEFLDARPHQVRLKTQRFEGDDFPEVFVCHAGMPKSMIGRDNNIAKNHCLYGEVEGFMPGTKKPIRSYNWRKTWEVSPKAPLLVHGHDVVPEPSTGGWVNVINVDQGCCFGGKLTALRVPEMHIEQVNSTQPNTLITDPNA